LPFIEAVRKIGAGHAERIFAPAAEWDLWGEGDL